MARDMARDMQRVESLRGEYSENLLPAFCAFENSHTWNIVSGVFTVVSSSEQTYQKNNSIKITMSNVDPCVFSSGGTEMNFTADKAGDYIFSARAFIPSTGISDGSASYILMNCYVNGLLLPENILNMDLSTGIEGFTFGSWNTFCQTIQLSASDVVSFTFQAHTDTPGAICYLSGLKNEFDDRNLFIPTIYSLPKDYCCGDDEFILLDAGAVTNATTLALSESDLNTAYPDALEGFRVLAPDIIAGALIYHKTASGWISTVATNVT